MTIGQLVECVLGKVAALDGQEGDATPFTSVTVENISKALHAFGYQRRGNEVRSRDAYASLTTQGSGDASGTLHIVLMDQVTNLTYGTVPTEH